MDRGGGGRLVAVEFPRRPWLIAGRVALVTTVFIATSFRDVVSLDACRCLTVHFLDVGQGDAAALRTPNGRWMVIDGGPRNPQGDAGRRVGVPFLRSRAWGGWQCRGDPRATQIIWAGCRRWSRRSTRSWCSSRGAAGAAAISRVSRRGRGIGRAVARARAGDRIEVDGVVLEVLSPDSLWLRLPLDVNDHGVVLRVRYGSRRLLFQADAGLPVEGRLAGQWAGWTCWKVGHHGSRTATSDEWSTNCAARGGDQRGSEQQLWPSGARGARTARAPRHYGVPDRSERHHHFLHGWAG